MNFPFFKMIKRIFNKEQQKEKRLEETAFTGGQYSTITNQSEVAATDAMVEGMNLFRQAAEQKAAIPVPQKQGNLFEYIEATKFNSASALKNSNLKAYVTEAEGNPHAAADILIKEGDKVIKEVQAKSSKSPQNALRELFEKRDKYIGMDKLTNKEHIAAIKRKTSNRAAKGNTYSADYEEINVNSTSELKTGEINSGGTSYREAFKAAQNPNLSATMYEVKCLVQEVGIAGAQATVAGLILGGSISIIKNGLVISREDKRLEEATKEVIQDTINSGVRSGVVGCSGSIMRYGAKKAGFKGLERSNIATAIAAGTIEIGVIIYNFIKEEISAEEAMEKVGKIGISIVSSVYTGVIAGMAFGPTGAVIGSIASYIIASNVYQSSIAIFKNANLVVEETAKVVALYEEATKQLAKQRIEFEKLITERIKIKNQEFETCFNLIDQSLKETNPKKTARGLADFVISLDNKLKFKNFEEFDTYMINSDNALKL